MSCIPIGGEARAGYSACTGTRLFFSLELEMRRLFVTMVLMMSNLLGIFAPVIIKNIKTPAINISSGRISGVLIEFRPSGKYKLSPTAAFLGLTFASLGNSFNRFLFPTMSVEKWNRTKFVNETGSTCPQQKVNLSNPDDLARMHPHGRPGHLKNIRFFVGKTTEDCLSLNVYRPSYRGKNESTRLPVMIFIHGESYDIGTGNAYDGSVLASYGKVIVITVNYRLGVLGFLSTGHANANGNQALMDLTAVLTWVKDNIASFDGDPNRVTLFGHGHGAALVNFLLLVPTVTQNKLFHRAILQSGSAGSTWAESVDPLACAQKLAININCTKFLNNSVKLIRCLKNRTADQLVNNAPVPPKYHSCFAPSTKSGALFPKSLDEMMAERNTFSNIPIMLGVTKNEAYSYMKESELKNGISEFRKRQILRTYVQNVYKYHRQKIYEILDHEYSNWDRIQDNNSRRDNIMELISDGQYVAPLIRMAKKLSKTSNTYLYSFGYSTESEKNEFPKWSGGVHGDELPYVFGAPLVDGISPFPSKYSKGEKRLSASIMRFWTNFAKSGNPNEPVKESVFEKDKFADIKWPTYNENTQQYLQIGRRPSIRNHYRGKQLAMWLDLIPKINKEDSLHEGKPDSAEHNLIDPKNMSTFDEPNRLITHFHRLYPAPPVTSTTTNPPPQDKPDGNMSSPKYNNPKPSEGSQDVTTGEQFSPAPPVPGSVASESLARSSVPLSITVAIGCSLLFLNILFFAGVYYQRERIKKLKRAKHVCEEEMRTSRKNDNDDCNASKHETVSLMTSPQNQNQLTPIKTINSRPEISNPIYAAISKSSDSSSDKYSYSPVPTNSSSPVHRTRNPHSQTNNVQSPYKSVTTFSSGRPPDRSPKSDRKNIKNNDRCNQKTNKENHSSNTNNAITIV